MRRGWAPILTPRWLLTHALAVLLVLAMLGLGWWQVRRAAGGNLLSFGYAVEWPAFAAFVVYVWVKEARQALRGTPPAEATAGGDPEPAPPPARRRERVGAAYDDTDDAELAAYNRYLAWLNAHPHASPSDYPG